MKTLKYILPLIAGFGLVGCSDDTDMGFDFSDPAEETYEDGCSFHISAAPYTIEGEETEYDSRAYNTMTPDRENMIQSLFVLQYDNEGNLQLMDNGKRYLYHNFVDIVSAAHGVSMVTEENMPELAFMSSAFEMNTCLIANADFDKMYALIFPTGDENAPVTWEQFQQIQFELSFATDTDILEDGSLERGHLTKVLMFGYYYGVVPSKGFTLALGRIVSRIQVNFTADNNQRVGQEMLFFGAMHNVERSSYFFVPTEDSPHDHLDDGEIFLLDESHIDFTSTGGMITYYVGPHVGPNIKDKEDATAMNIWCVRGEWVAPQYDANGDLVAGTGCYSLPADKWPTWEEKHHTILLGTDPKSGDYSLNRNTIYNYNVTFQFPDVKYSDNKLIYLSSAYINASNGDILKTQDFQNTDNNGTAEVTVEASRILNDNFNLISTLDNGSDGLLAGSMINEDVMYELADYSIQPAGLSQEMYTKLQGALVTANSRAIGIKSVKLEGLTLTDLKEIKNMGGFYISIKGNYNVLLKVNINLDYPKKYKIAESTDYTIDSNVDEDGNASITIEGSKLILNNFDFSALLGEGFGNNVSYSIDNATLAGNFNTTTAVFTTSDYFTLSGNNVNSKFVITIHDIYDVNVTVNIKYTFKSFNFIDGNGVTITDNIEGENYGHIIIDGEKLISGFNFNDLIDSNENYTFRINYNDQPDMVWMDVASTWYTYSNEMRYNILNDALNDDTGYFQLYKPLYSDLGDDGFNVWLMDDGYPYNFNVRINDKLKDVKWSSGFDNTNPEIGYRLDATRCLQAGALEIDIQKSLNTSAMTDGEDHATQNIRNDVDINWGYNDGENYLAKNFFTKFRNYELYDNDNKDNLLIYNYGNNNTANKAITDGLTMTDYVKQYVGDIARGIVWYDREFRVGANDLSGVLLSDGVTPKEKGEFDNSKIPLTYDDDNSTFYHDEYNNKNFWWSYNDNFYSLMSTGTNTPQICLDYGINITDDGKIVTGANYGGFCFYLKVGAFFEYAYGIKRLCPGEQMFQIWFNRYYVPETSTWPRTDNYDKQDWY